MNVSMQSSHADAAGALPAVLPYKLGCPETGIEAAMLALSVPAPESEAG
jgi:hypothetical protein